MCLLNLLQNTTWVAEMGRGLLGVDQDEARRVHFYLGLLRNSNIKNIINNYIYTPKRRGGEKKNKKEKEKADMRHT